MKRNRKNERGVTLMVAAFTLLAILAMAAISVDVAQLYVARGESQKAADAAALAGAKMFVTSGYTSVQGSGFQVADINNLCQTGGPGQPFPVNSQAEAVAAQNTIAGQPAVVTNIQCNHVTSVNPTENPTVSVSVTRTGIPTFFARVFGNSNTTTNATSTAEAYNPSTNTTPIQTSVKPWLIPNCNPGMSNCNGPYFVDPGSGQVLQNGSFIGTKIQLNIITSGPGQTSNTVDRVLDSYALNLPTTDPPICPVCGEAAGVYFQNVACSTQVQMKCGDTVGGTGFGGGGTIGVERFGVNASTTMSGGRCMIHASNDDLGQGQDVLTPGPPPIAIQGGENNPNPALVGVSNISRSDSIVTVPIYDGTQLCTGGGGRRGGGGCTTVKSILGFLQLAITRTVPSGGPGPTQGQIEGIIVNAAGCGNTTTSTPITGSGLSPIPVRLIHQ
ncbi:MAG TPA: pilus assembly protein TadG-related protein [Terriglobales bacterium]